MVKAFRLPEQLQDKDRLTKLNHVQQEAVLSLRGNDWTGTLCMATGSGKTFTAFKYLIELLNEELISSTDEIWFLAETTTRQRTLVEEAEKFDKVYGSNPLYDFNIKFHCYQAKPVGTPKVIIADEIHDSLTPIYSEVYANEHVYTLGLSATIPFNLQVYRDDEDNDLTKGELLNTIAPIVFNYPLSNAIDDGILSPFRTTVIEHQLDATQSNIPDRRKKKDMTVSEQSYYSFRMGVINWNDPFGKYTNYKANCGRQAAQVLWNLPSKAKVVKDLLKTLEGKTIIFGVQLELLKQITPNVVRAAKKVTKEQRIKHGMKSESTKLQEAENNRLIDAFNNGDISVIAAAKKLKQGITLDGVTNAIIVSYYKESYHMIQQLGRIVRFVPDKLANLYILRTNNTYEEVWFKNLNKERDEKGKVVNEIDLNIVSNDIIKRLAA